jgi:putative transposase
VAAGGLGAGKTVAAAQEAWICFEDEAGQNMRPPIARTWAQRGQTPTVSVSGKGSGRISIAGLVCLKPHQHGRWMYRTIVHRGRKGERKSFSETDYIELLDAAHQRLHAPLVVIWDNLNTHVSAAMRALIDARDWLTVIRLPAYAPDLNPVESAWSNVKNELGNLGTRTLDDLHRIVRNRLKRIQYRPELLDGFLAQTGLTLDGAE